MNLQDYSRYLRQCQPFCRRRAAKTCKFSLDYAVKVDRRRNPAYNKKDRREERIAAAHGENVARF